MYRGAYYVADDFAGGYCGNLPSSDLTLNQAADCDNIVVGPGGKSFRTMWPTVRLNATEFGTSGWPVVGIGIGFNGGSGPSALFIQKGKAYSFSDLLPRRDVATAVDRTGAVVLSSGSGTIAQEAVTYRYNFCRFDTLLIGFGGNITGPDAPFKWTGGSANIAALGGSPPSANFGISANNRVFAFLGSTMYWCALGNAEDWTSAGSGSAVIGNLDDDAPVTDAVVLSNSVMLVFKQKKIYQVNISSAPFSNYLLFDGIGAACTRATVMVSGVCYFVDNIGRMHSTDGSSVRDYPPNADNLIPREAFFYSGNSPPLPTVCGFRAKTDEYDLVVWSMRGSNVLPASTFAWDLRNSCWVRFSTGFNFVSAAIAPDSAVYGGSYGGYIYTPDCAGYGINDTDGIPVVTGFWRTGWLSQKSLSKLNQIRRVGLSMATTTSPDNSIPPFSAKLTGSWSVIYGYDFIPDTNSFSLSAAPDSTETQTFRFDFPKGRGISTQYKFVWVGSNQSNMAARVNSILFAGKSGGQARISAT